MKVIRAGDELRTLVDLARRDRQSVGFVPTMGALHDGHLALVTEARRRVDDRRGGTARGLVVVSIFVNPTQFGPNEDYARYPRALPLDLEKCERAAVDVVFAPEVSEVYPPGEQTRVRVGALGDVLCGPFRPGHFEGVATVVTKLFALVGPSIAVFGRKDYQQLRIIDRLARDLCLGVEVLGHRTVREPDGLAMSSRNVYLGASERARALAIPRALAAATAAFDAGERRADALVTAARAVIESAADSIDYVAVHDPETLAPLDAGVAVRAPLDAGAAVRAATVGLVGERALLAVALRIGPTRLIDNVVLGEDPSPLERRSG